MRAADEAARQRPPQNSVGPMTNSTLLSRRPASGQTAPAFPDYYSEERWAQTRVRARQARARNALILIGLMTGIAGLAGGLRRWDLGLQP
jgi:hypothetical protein